MSRRVPVIPARNVTPRTGSPTQICHSLDPSMQKCSFGGITYLSAASLGPRPFVQNDLATLKRCGDLDVAPLLMTIIHAKPNSCESTEAQFVDNFKHFYADLIKRDRSEPTDEGDRVTGTHSFVCTPSARLLALGNPEKRKKLERTIQSCVYMHVGYAD